LFASKLDESWSVSTVGLVAFASCLSTLAARSVVRSASLASTDKALSANFEQNRGRLPAPITTSYIVVSRFGQYNVQGMKNVTLDNKGIDIKGSAGGAVRAVFNGRVSSIFQYGGRYIVMIRHGKFISVYSGLASVSVSNGANVSTNQTIGSIGLDESGEPVIQFQLRKESSKLNPEAWVR
jgi:septal ring factor EnvC (AmiA/AmiB activator)